MRYHINNIIHRAATLLVLLMAGWAAGGTLSAQETAGDLTLTPDPATNLTGTASGDNIQPLTAWTDNDTGIYFSFETGTGRTAPAYYANGANVRLYSGNTFQLHVPEGCSVTEVVFDNSYTSSSEKTLSVDTGNLEYSEEVSEDGAVGMRNYIWTNSDNATVATFTLNDTQIRLTSVRISYTGGSVSDRPKAPVISEKSRTFYLPFEITIVDPNEPAGRVYYTLDGSEPSAQGILYTGPVTIPEGADVTVKAVVVTELGTSNVAIAAYTYEKRYAFSYSVNNKNAISSFSYDAGDAYDSLSPDQKVYIAPGLTVYLNWGINSGYKLNSVKNNGVLVENPSYGYNFTMPEEDVTLAFDALFDPSSPGDPQPPVVKYKLTRVANPAGAYQYGNASEYAAGESVYVSSGTQSGYKFLNWTKDGHTIGTESSFYYEMPAADVVLVANYVYSPSDPGDPQQPKLTHPLTVVAQPAGSATFSKTADGIVFGEEYYVYAYPQTGYKFVKWILNGVPQDETSTTFHGTMTEAGANLVAVMKFDPSTPSNPGANYYNPTTGLAIIDDFLAGNLYNALSNTVGYDNYGNVSRLIVKGKMTSNDYGCLSYLTNANTIDLSRTGNTAEVPGYAFQSMAASDILLSASVASIGNYAFSNCSNLISLTVYAQEPPVCSSNTFTDFTNKDNCTVFVPASAVELYSNADCWKDFTILPINNDAHVLQVNLPADGADGRYKHNSIEIVNLNSGVRQKYVVSDRMLYTFNSLQKDEQYNVYMYSQAGLEIGRIENVVIPDQDSEVTFDNLKSLHTVYAKVLASDGTDVTPQVSVEWLKPLADGTETYLRKAVSLGEIPDGQQLICRITLDDRLGVVYANPEDVEFTVSADNNICTLNLAPFRSIELTGSVVDGDEAALSGASVSINQTLNDKYSKTYTAKTDRTGKWNLSVLEAPETRLTFAATECVNVNDTIGAFEASVNTLDLGKTVLKSIVGTRVSYGFTYHAAGSEEMQDYYSDYQNVAVSVFNVTQNRAHNEVSLQYPILAVLDENINVGDVLKLTATSKTGAFNPIVESVTVGENQRAEVTFDIVGKGGISAMFEMTENAAVTAMLYGSNGELKKKMTYSEAKALFTELEDGEYTLITMGQSDLMNSILRLSNFGEIGLAEGKDYVKNMVNVESGKLSEVKIAEVPAFDESLFYYTNSATGFSANKSSITTGNYLTLSSTIGFKGIYANDISNVALVVDLPEACDFIENSVIQGPNLLPYTIDNNRLTVQLGDKYKTQTRFCVVPTCGGLFNASASIVFDYNGKSVTQPIGSAASEIKDIEISVPNVIAKSEFLVSGTALPNSTVNVFADNELVGSGRSNKKGIWTATCILAECPNRSKHNVYAEIKTPDNITMHTAASEMIYDSYAITPKNVLMSFYNGWLKKNVDVNFNFETNKIEPSNYMFYTQTDLTFMVDFTNNSPEKLSVVMLHLFTQDGRVLNLPCTYDENKDIWYGTVNCGYNDLPVNMSISYSTLGSGQLNRNNYEGAFSSTINEFNTQKSYSENINDIFSTDYIPDCDNTLTNQMLVLIESEEFNIEQFELLNDQILSSLGIDSEDSVLSPEETDSLYESELDEYNAWIQELRTSVFEAGYLLGIQSPTAFDIDVNGELSDTSEAGTVYKREFLSEIDEEALTSDGFLSFEDDSGYKIFAKIENGIIVTIDSKDKSKVSFEYNMLSTSLMRLSASKTALGEEFDSSCFDLISNLVKTLEQQVNELSGYIDTPKTFSEKFSSIIKVLNNIVEATQCAYKSAYDYVKYNGLKIFDKQFKDINGKKRKQEKIIAGYVSDNKDLKDGIASLRKDNRYLKSEFDKIQQLLSNPELSAEQIANYKETQDNLDTRIKHNKLLIESKVRRLNSNIRKIENCNSKITGLKDKFKSIENAKNKFLEKLNKLPAGTLFKDYKLDKWVRAGGKLAGGLGVLVEIICFFEDVSFIVEEGCLWDELLLDAIKMLPCKDDASNALKLIRDICLTSCDFCVESVAVMLCEAFAIGVDAFSLTQPEATLGLWLLSGIPNGFANVVNVFGIQNDLVLKRGDFYVRKMQLHCNLADKWPWESWWDEHKPSKWAWWDKFFGNRPEPPFTEPTTPIHDPSGFVYEAVPDNRVEGVQASIYYKETKENMYGDPYEEVVLWDAEEYAQKNPLFTDENGMYQWDVPQGLWQVKFEKDGYQTAFSEWLPVPPPQLDVNIGIVQNKQPEVTEARAYEEGVEVQFDKFMDLSTLTTDNIYVTANGEKLTGEIRMIDSTLADEYASEEDPNALRYASRVRFVPEQPLSVTTGEVRVTVSRNVLSYAGIPMTETFSQVLDVEKEVQMIVADDVKVLYGGEKEVTVHAVPFDAAVGRTLHIANSSALIASVDVTEATLDAEGKAVVKVKGDLPGRAQLTFTIDDVTATGECAVDVVTEIITAEAPKSSRASGSAVYRGSKIELTTDSKNATIYFTTDGSCPCDENGTRRKYTVPIVINEDTKILAMTSVGTGDEDMSETVEFNYTLKHSDMDFRMEEGWTWMSHNFDNAVASSVLSAEESVSRILTQTQELIRDPQLGMVGTLTELSASESFKVETSAAVTGQRLSDIARNPATPIALNSGWNWLGYPVGQTMTVDEAFATTEAETLDIVVGQNGFAQFDGEKWIGTLETMSPGLGYMYQSQSAKNVVYNTSIVSTASAKHASGISGNSPLVLDIHKYGVIMPLVATINGTDGSQLDNEDYQVAAFCGTECRGIGRIVNGLVMMNVYGNPDDGITFNVTDADGELSFSNDASLKFSETVVGDIFNPYVLMINSQSGVSDVKYDGNIKVAVEDDMLRIKGIAPDDIDLVEIYDIKGQKLIRETNVSESGIRISSLTNGVYVVIVKGNGEYSYHKIAIR